MFFIILIQAFGLNHVQIILLVNDICGTCLIINNYDILMFAHELKKNYGFTVNFLHGWKLSHQKALLRYKRNHGLHIQNPRQVSVSKSLICFSFPCALYNQIG